MHSSLEQRVAHLEKNLRLYRIAFAALIIIATGLVTMAFNNRYVPDVLEAKAFRVVDDNGKVLVTLNGEREGGQISTYSPNGTRLVRLFTTESGTGGINTFSKDGRVLFKVTNTTEGGGYMAVFNGAIQEIAEIGVTNLESGYFRLNDRNGKKQVWMTYTQGGGGYLSLSDNGQELIRFSTPAIGGRLGIYNNANTRIAYIGTQDTKDGNITVWNSAGTRLAGLP